MTGAPSPNVLIDVDCSALSLSPNAAKCDFVFAGGTDNVVAPLELKRGSLRASEALAQLRAGARFVQQKVSSSIHVRFVPIAVVGGKIHPSELSKLRKSRVQFRGKPVGIALLRCGQPIANILK